MRSAPDATYDKAVRRCGGIPGLRVVLHANVVDLELVESGEAVRSVGARTLGGRTLRVEARQVVLAPGRLESARLLFTGSHRMLKVSAMRTVCRPIPAGSSGCAHRDARLPRRRASTAPLQSVFTKPARNTPFVVRPRPRFSVSDRCSTHRPP